MRLRGTDMTISGVCVAMCTPFDPTGEQLDEGRLRSFIDELIDAGVHSILLGAGTGEYAYMRPDEIRRIIEISGKHIDGRVPICTQSTMMSTSDTIEATKFAVDHGAEAVMVLPPWLESPFERGVVYHYEEVARRTSADLMLYNNPGASGVEITPGMFRRLAQVDNVKYMKDSEGDLAKHQKFIAIGQANDTHLLCGADPIAPYAIMAGAAGWIWGSANVMPHECVALFDHLTEGRHAEALELWAKMLPFNSFQWDNDFGVEYLVGAKTAAKMVGRDLGPNRRPQLPPTGDGLTALQSALSTLPINKVDRQRLVYRAWDADKDWLRAMTDKTLSPTNANQHDNAEDAR